LRRVVVDLGFEQRRRLAEARLAAHQAVGTDQIRLAGGPHAGSEPHEVVERLGRNLHGKNADDLAVLFDGVTGKGDGLIVAWRVAREIRNGQDLLRLGTARRNTSASGAQPHARAATTDP
jgi:hypothetical protein